MIWTAVDEDVDIIQHVFISNWNKIWIFLELFKSKLLALFIGPEFKITSLFYLVLFFLNIIFFKLLEMELV